MLKKVAIKENVPESELTSVNLRLLAEKHKGAIMMMHQVWMQEFVLESEGGICSLG